MTEIPCDVWNHCIVKWLSPIDILRLRSCSSWFRQNIKDVWKPYRVVETASGLEIAVINNDRKFIDYFCRGANMEWGKEYGLRYAAETGNRELVDFFIGKGAHWWNGALIGASIGNHRDLIEFSIEKGGRLGEYVIKNLIDSGVSSDMINFIKENQSNFEPT